jgi:hypothetical protein
MGLFCYRFIPDIFVAIHMGLVLTNYRSIYFVHKPLLPLDN